MAVLGCNPQPRRDQHRIVVGALITALHVSDDLLLHADHFGSGIERRSASLNRANGKKLSALDSLRKFMPHLFVGCLRHATADRRLQDASFILYGKALKDMIASIGNGLLLGRVRAGCVKLSMFVCLGYNAIRLMAVLCSQLAVPLQYLFWRMNLLAVPRPMSSNLCRTRAFSS